ncbi:hypothetical protein HFN01_00410 [Rhizobium leguminosarum]|uniref:hypothetical protein n=1 Tax=Rhizobium leguminosarum TaxID=384 RepID=UPI001C93DE9B|nr:hypothetical protein [Rhizobium leguminosarum]MBY5393290.1 hypothetical protein [Rhizobium leguminosarum]
MREKHKAIIIVFDRNPDPRKSLRAQDERVLLEFSRRRIVAEIQDRKMAQGAPELRRSPLAH